MLSRLPAPPVPALATRPDWDIFCRVVDNFGDIGVCWRLARQLASEHGQRVRLWVDDLDRFRWLCPIVDPELPRQWLQGIELRRWGPRWTPVMPAPVVLETFACRIPEAFVEAMAQLRPPPRWINLDYLSAESWVADFHAQPSPHPRLPLVKYFFFPGFATDTGGLLRENDLRARRDRFMATADRQRDWWHRLGAAPPPAGTLRVSLFAYENPALGELLHLWQASPRPVCCLVPLAGRLPAIEAYAGKTLQAGDIVRRGGLEIRLLPFLEQPAYDELLWLCELNFVRGEDSFVRAQWAAQPLVWHIYRQPEAAHLIKLDAFLARYCAALPPTDANPLRDFWQGWNAGRVDHPSWQRLAARLPELRAHAKCWEKELAGQDDLLSRLLRGSRSGL
ncbi:MAG: elongation factor P maturation arginine rhamnosyltransferase EarP [Candidatus Accumulibacter sp. UW26]|jgi:uncharacterized repeat protein (TIGR03837 family)